MENYEIENNEFLSDGPINAYYHEEYSAEMGKHDDYSRYIHVLKNTFNTTSQSLLDNASKELYDVLSEDLESIVDEENFNRDVVVIGVPRAQSDSSYDKNQLLFRSTLAKVADSLGLIDGNKAVIRIVDTKTTHISKPTIIINKKANNLLKAPYPGISRDTCDIDIDTINGKNIILVDDVYTKNANIAEDLIQSLLDFGAKKIVFYSCWYTVR